MVEATAKFFRLKRRSTIQEGHSCLECFTLHHFLIIGFDDISGFVFIMYSHPDLWSLIHYPLLCIPAGKSYWACFSALGPLDWSLEL